LKNNQNKMLNPRKARADDLPKIKLLYLKVSESIGGLARTQDEITDQYIAGNFENATYTGIQLVVDHPGNSDEIIAEIHCYKLAPKVFSHLLGELTIAVHPDFQGKGLGKILFTALLEEIKAHRKEILRVELIARESNQKAITFYQNLGFKIEGRLENRMNSGNGSLEADIPMAWFNPNFKP